MKYEYNLEEIKENLTVEQVADLVAELGGEPIIKGDIIVCKTICHHHGNELDKASHKLYYYGNTQLFRCYTDCGDTFDIFELVKRVREPDSSAAQGLPPAIKFVADYFGYGKNAFQEEEKTEIDDYLTSLENYDRIKEINKETKKVELKVYDDSFLKNFPRPAIIPWYEDNITQEAMNRFEICYNPKSQAIVIPHRNLQGELIGVRERTLIKENAEKYGKYLPLKFNGTMYNHPLSFNVYGLYQNQENIKNAKMAIILESEKSVMQLDGILGVDNNIGVACCGSNVISYQVSLLQSLGVKEIVIALDRQYKELNDNEHKKLCRNLRALQKKYGNYIKVSYIFDVNGLLPYKASPSDAGKQIFMQLFRERKSLY